AASGEAEIVLALRMRALEAGGNGDRSQLAMPVEAEPDDVLEVGTAQRLGRARRAGLRRGDELLLVAVGAIGREFDIAAEAGIFRGAVPEMQRASRREGVVGPDL